MILNGLPQKRTEIILSFLRLHPSTAFRTLVDHDGYSISSEGFLPFHYRGLECKSRKSRDNLEEQTWPWLTKQGRSKVNRVLPRECTSPITSWHIDGEEWKQWQIFFRLNNH